MKEMEISIAHYVNWRKRTCRIWEHGFVERLKNKKSIAVSELITTSNEVPPHYMEYMIACGAIPEDKAKKVLSVSVNKYLRYCDRSSPDERDRILRICETGYVTPADKTLTQALRCHQPLVYDVIVKILCGMYTEAYKRVYFNFDYKTLCEIMESDYKLNRETSKQKEESSCL